MRFGAVLTIILVIAATAHGFASRDSGNIVVMYKFLGKNPRIIRSDNIICKIPSDYFQV